MEYLNNIIEYYDELYPVTEAQKSWFKQLAGDLLPARYLRIGCGTGALEYYLAKEGHDVTGLDVSRELLECANRRRRLPNMAVRFFQMSSVEMTHFLGKGFYNVISCMNDKLIFIHDRTLMRKFFYDCRQLLAQGGRLVIGITNFSRFTGHPMVKLPEHASIRVKLFSQLWVNDAEEYTLSQDLERAGSKVMPVLRNEPVIPVSVDAVKEYAREAGFSSCQVFSDFESTPFSPDSDTALLVFS